MRVLLDYRAALRQRSGVGEYTHHLAHALLKRQATLGIDASFSLTLFSSSRKDRLRLDADLAAAATIDRKIPVRLLNLLWHRFEWPTAERLAGGHFDIAHSMHPLLMPTSTAAQVVTIHDLNFMHHPERTSGEIRRDYPVLARAHAHRADRVIAVSEFTARETERLFGIDRSRITVCSPGAPPWTPRTASPDPGYILFFGTLEPRKNVGALLDAYETLLMRRSAVPELLLAGKATESARPWLERIAKPPLATRVRHIGYVADEARRALYDGARMLVQPSFEEGFGLTVLEAMSAGVPVVAADRGALPEVLGGAGILVDTADREEFAAGLARVLDDRGQADAMSAAGVARASHYTPDRMADRTLEAYDAALAHRSTHKGRG